MKKILLIMMFCLCLIGCENNEENKKALLGEWEYKESKIGSWGDYYSYNFIDKNTVKYWECKDLTLGNEGCKNGSSVWIGKYRLRDNIIELLDFEIDKSNSYNPTDNLRGPLNKLIVNFDDMYICDRDKGMDCNKKYEKDTSE